MDPIVFPLIKFLNAVEIENEPLMKLAKNLAWTKYG